MLRVKKTSLCTGMEQEGFKLQATIIEQPKTPNFEPTEVTLIHVRVQVE